MDFEGRTKLREYKNHAVHVMLARSCPPSPFLHREEVHCVLGAMSSRMPTGQSFRSTPAAEAQRVAIEDRIHHDEAKHELEAIVKKQAERIEQLKITTARDLEHHSNLRRKSLEERKASALEAIAQITPRLEIVRSQWNHAKQQNQGFEMQWGSMRTQYQQVKQRVDALHDTIEDGRNNIEATRKSLSEMTEHHHKLDRDRASLRSKLKRALECNLIDQNFLSSRMREEENYHQQMQQALAAMETEYQDSQVEYRHEFSPLEEDVQVLSNYLEEMQARSKELEKYCLELEGKAASIEEQWLESVHNVFEGLERANHIDQLRNKVLTELEQQKESFRQANAVARTRAGHNDFFWLANAVAVWEFVVSLVTQERQKMHIRDDRAQFLAETSQKCQQAKALLASVKAKVEGTGSQRKQLFQDVLNMHYLIIEKKEDEEQTIKYLQEVATQLDEDLSHILYVMRKEGYDDYVSSTDEG